jgi:hypothetical protein
MNNPLRYKAGSKLGIAFHVRYPLPVEALSNGQIAEGTIPSWRSVCVRTILKDRWKDAAGKWRDTVHFYELVPSDGENRIDVDEFYVAGRFEIVRHEKNATEALQAWKAFKPS